MDGATFRAWLSGVEHLTPEQRQELHEFLRGREPGAEVAATVEDRLTAERCCPHCSAGGAVKRGRANGLRRYRCKACGKTFNALTGTPLARLRHKDRWLDFAHALSDGETIRRSAKHCGVAVTTAFCCAALRVAGATAFYRPSRPAPSGCAGSSKPMKALSGTAVKATGISSARPASAAAKRGLSREQVPVLVAADRSGTTLSTVLPELSAKAIQAVLEPAIDKDALLVTDGAAVHPRCAADLGISHEALNQSAGERVRGDLHIQTVNNRHQRLKSFLAPFRGIATKYLSNYLRWFDIVGLAPQSSARACLNAALGLQPSVGVVI